MEQQQCTAELAKVLPQNLKESMESIAKNEQFTNYEVVSNKISTDGGSYMGVLYEIVLKGKTTEGDKEVNIFVKNIVDNVDMAIYSVPGVFETEAWVYRDLFTVFAELQEEANMPKNERLNTPHSFPECNPKSIILEHLGKRGFKLYHRMKIITLQYAEKCVKELAKFHALSFVVKDKRPNYFNEQIITKKQPYNFGEDWYAFVKNMANYSISCLEPKVKEAKKEILLSKADDYPTYMRDTSTVCTLCHGDYKLNNVMAKEVNGEISEVVPIDFQILHYGCPILDFVYFMFQGTDQEFREKHLVYLRDLYYETVEAFLLHFNIKIEDFFPRTEFDNLYKKKLDFGLMVNIFYGPFLYALEGDAPDVTTQELSTIDFQVDNRFTERFRGVVDDFIRWGYI